MKRILLSAVALLAGVLAFAQQMPPIPVDQAVRIGKLENGLTYYVRHNEEPQGQANFYIAQKVGSILENEDQRGLAHFLEHMCFNGTENFPGNGIIAYCEKIGVKFGADLNAYTSIDETVYNIDNVPVANVPSAVDSCLLILHDWAGALLLEGDDIDKERGVIHEEWRSRQNAQMRQYDVILPKIYPGNKYGQRMPIGTMEVVDNFPYEAIRSYYRTWYRPDQQGIVVVGDVDVDAVEKKIVDIFGTLPAAAADAPERTYLGVEDNEETIVAIAKDKEQPYALTYIFAKHDAITPAEKYNLDYYLYQYADQVANIMIGQRINEMTEVADPDFIQGGMSDEDFFISKTKGAFAGIAVTDENQVLRGMTSIYREMLRVVRNGFTESEYTRARSELLTQVESQYNQREKRKSAAFCKEYVRHFIDNEPIPGIETEFALLQQLAPNIPVQLVNQVVSEHMTEGRNLVVACMLPDKEGVVYPTEDEIKAALAAVAAEEIAPYEDKVSDEPLISKMPKAGKIKKVSEDKFGYTKMVLSNGATVYVKTTDFNKDQVLLSAFSWGGTALYPVTPTLKAVDDLAGIGGLGNFNNPALEKALAGKKASAHASISNMSESVSGNSTPKDIETMFQLVYLNFTALRADNEAFASWKTKTAAMLLNAESQPMSAFQDTLSATIYDNPERVEGLKLAELESVDYAAAMKIAKERFANAADFTFVITGAVDVETLKPLLEKYIASLPAKKNKKEAAKMVYSFANGQIDKQFDQPMEVPMATNLFLNHTECQYDPRTSAIADIAGQTLSIVLLEEIREKEGGTYGISAHGMLQPAPANEALMQIVYQCDPDRAEYLNKRVEEIVAEFTVNGPRAEDLAKVKEYLQKTAKENLRENRYWAGAMNAWLRYGVDTVDGYSEMIESISAEDIKAFMASLSEGNSAKLVMVGVAK